jgi:hypothetical protein
LGDMGMGCSPEAAPPPMGAPPIIPILIS